ncbi:ATP-binding protein [Methylorubrum extorquens]|jgi:hypothetical protein|uniref:ORC1/DEAH AAA+ ATPase domain-containing protein n=1 Tax=Methylorubrum extorquens (strain ATCC 14718 / DSM 1338 / JCM 2805 / NCIMB 9133 / AM1) TaxID=272630 RepID=C5ASL0_METEA|nr:AAA family ATPase [Methylorubrum extorquens]ACS40451.1 conserved hypothetical protein [Methylorubrum extorquens AM1]MCP1541403.1 hypothetical protein [Methylorubrum extorquens]MCP1586061.1 hypothetical protein [Methylorubrum extorquens]
MLQAHEADIFRPDVTVLAPQEAVPARRERFATRLSPQDLERRAWKRRVNTIHVNTDVVVKAVARFDQMLADLADDVEGQCLVVPAPSGAGKSHLLARLQMRPSLVPFRDEVGPVRPLVFIKAPSPCTLKTLGLALYVALTDLELSATLKEHDIWRRVRHQMHAQLVSVVMVDEFHHALRGRTGDERRALVETLKNLVIPDPNDPLRPPGAEMRPISLVLSGMPWLRRVLKEDFQLLRRCIFMPIRPLGHSAACVKKATKFLELIEPRLGFPAPSGLSEHDMVQRMLKASAGYTGRMMHLVKKAAFRAIRSGAPSISQLDHLAFVFDEIFELGPHRNPFRVPDISTCPKLKEIEFDKLTRLMGTAQADIDPDDA